MPPFYDAFCGGFWPNVDASSVFRVEVSLLFWLQALHDLPPFCGAGPYELLSCDDFSRGFCGVLCDGLYGEPCFEQSLPFGLVEVVRQLLHPLDD